MSIQTPGGPPNAGFMTGISNRLALVERLHRLLLDVIKDEFERVGVLEINAVQALLLFNIGDNEVTAGELKSRGYYQGSNVSYNLKKLVEMGYMHHQRCEIDRRSVRVRLTEKGREHPRHRRRAVRPPCRGAADARRARPEGIEDITTRCAGSNATGPTRSATSTDRLARKLHRRHRLAGRHLLRLRLGLGQPCGRRARPVRRRRSHRWPDAEHGAGAHRRSRSSA
jgi:DNA-binding MarR family transcriptional regulator